MSNIETILQENDMKISRTPQGLCDWVNSKASELDKTPEGKSYARSGKQLPKKFWEEIRPLGLFACSLYGQRTDVKCTPNLTNENYDGIIEFNDAASSPVYIEITYAKEGDDERLRLGVLSKCGSVNMLGTITKSGTKAAGNQKVAIVSGNTDHDINRDKALEIVKTRILAKSKSKKDYGPNYVLVVVVDDFLPFRDEEDKAELVEFVESIVQSVKLDFRAVFLLGGTGNYLTCVSGEI